MQKTRDKLSDAYGLAGPGSQIDANDGVFRRLALANHAKFAWDGF